MQLTPHNATHASCWSLSSFLDILLFNFSTHCSLLKNVPYSIPFNDNRMNVSTSHEKFNNTKFWIFFLGFGLVSLFPPETKPNPPGFVSSLLHHLSYEPSCSRNWFGSSCVCTVSYRPTNNLTLLSVLGISSGIHWPVRHNWWWPLDSYLRRSFQV